MLTNVCFSSLQQGGDNRSSPVEAIFARPVKLHFKPGECPLLAHLTDPKSERLMDKTMEEAGAEGARSCLRYCQSF